MNCPKCSKICSHYFDYVNNYICNDCHIKFSYDWENNFYYLEYLCYCIYYHSVIRNNNIYGSARNFSLKLSSHKEAFDFLIKYIENEIFQ